MDNTNTPVLATPLLEEGRPGFFKKWSSLGVMSLALAIIIIDTTLLNVSLETIIRELHTDLQSLQWVITSYALILTAFTITGGRLGDLFGRKRMFVLGAAIFAVGSFIASISPNIGILLIGESIIEGIGAVLMMPATASLLVANFRGRDRAIAFGVWGGFAAASSAIGPILGGYLTTHFSWRWGFRINVFVAALLLAGSVLVKESRDTEEKKELDWLGIVLSATGLLAVVYGIIESSTYGWFSAKKAFSAFGRSIDLGGISVTPFAVIIGIIFIGLFILWEQHREGRGRTPLVSLELFQNAQFTSGVLTTAVLSLGQTGMFFTLPVFLQVVRNLDAFHTGLTLLPMSIAVFFIAPASAALVKRIIPKHLIQLGLVADFVAVILIRQSLSVNATAWDLAPGLILYGIGMGLVMAQVSNLTLSAVSVQEAGEASGVNNTLRQLGGSLGSAIMGAVLLSALTGGFVSGIRASTVIPAQIKPQIEAQAAQSAESFQFGGGSGTAEPIPPAITAEIQSIGQRAVVDGNRQSLLYAIFFIALGILVSLKLPAVKNVERGQSAAHH